MLPFTPDRSIPPSPSAIVTPTNATTRHLHSNDNPFAVDIHELTKLLNDVKRNQRPDLLPSPPSSSSSSSSITSNKSDINQQLPSQFIFKKPFYNQHYLQTHYHHLVTHQNKDSAWSDLVKLFISEHQMEDDLFGNQFKQNIQDRYGKWGKCLSYFCLKKRGGGERESMIKNFELFIESIIY